MRKTLFVAMSLALVTSMAQAAENSVPDISAPTSTAMEHAKPNNTEVNKRDRDERTLTPMDQSNTQADIDITQAIRKALMKQELSLDAKNIKVITRGGEVTLRGPVSSKAEVQKIVKLAKKVPGINALNNELEVK